MPLVESYRFRRLHLDGVDSRNFAGQEAQLHSENSLPQPPARARLRAPQRQASPASPPPGRASRSLGQSGTLEEYSVKKCRLPTYTVQEGGRSLVRSTPRRGHRQPRSRWRRAELKTSRVRFNRRGQPCLASNGSRRPCASAAPLWRSSNKCEAHPRPRQRPHLVS